MVNPNIQKLEKARDTCADVFKSEVQDDVFDNGFLNTLTAAVTNVETAIRVLKERDELSSTPK